MDPSLIPVGIGKASTSIVVKAGGQVIGLSFTYVLIPGGGPAYLPDQVNGPVAPGGFVFYFAGKSRCDKD